ncbi:hypothetical protein BHM03_00049183, partial [Ensete ventricosum]
SSFSQKDALALPSPSLRRRRRRCPCASDGCLARRQSPLRTGRGRALHLLVVGDSPCKRRFYPQAPPLWAAAPAGDRLQDVGVCRPLWAPSASLAGWSWVAGPTWGLVVASRPSFSTQRLL